jgi:hypothetical protein
VNGGDLTTVRVDCAGVVIGFPAPDPRGRAALRRRFAGFVTDAPATVTTAREVASVLDAGGLVRSLLPGLLEDGLVAHAAVLLDGERGFLCCGRSGAGKSTLSRLAGSRRGSDELGAVRRVGGEWTVCSLPFWRGRAGSARLDGVFLLRHAACDERRRLSPAEATAAVGRHVLWPMEEPEAAQRALDLLADLVARVPVWDLGFVPTTAVWELIARPPWGGPPP